MVQAIKRDEAFIEPEGIRIETHQPERRSRKPPLLLVHGVLTGSWLWTEFAAFLAERGWEAHAMNLRGHFTSYAGGARHHVDARLRRRHRRGDAPPGPTGGRHRLGDRGAGRPDARRATSGGVLGLVLLAPSPPAAALPRRPDEHELRARPPIYDAAWWG